MKKLLLFIAILTLSLSFGSPTATAQVEAQERPRSAVRVKMFVWLHEDHKSVSQELQRKVQEWLDQNRNIEILDKVHSLAPHASGKMYILITFYYKEN